MSRRNAFWLAYAIVITLMLAGLPWHRILPREAPLFADIALGFAIVTAVATVAIGVRVWRNVGRKLTHA